MESAVSRGIARTFFNKFANSLDIDVAIVGAGPSGLTAAYYLAKAGRTVSVYEAKLAPGGGMWGGAMLFNEIIVQHEAIDIVREFSIPAEKIDDRLYVMDSVLATAALVYQARTAGAIIFNGMSVEDVVLDSDGGQVCGIVINWGPVVRAGMHVDPLVVRARAVLDGTGHPCEIAKVLSSKNDIRLNTPSGAVMGERSLAVEEGERTTVENTKEIYPGLFVSGMAANGVSGSFRMGPIFGGMLMSGRKVAGLINNYLETGKRE